MALPWQPRSSGGWGVCVCVCVLLCRHGDITSPPLIPRRHHCVSRPPLQLRFSFHLCHKFLQVEGGRGGGKEAQTTRLCRGAPRSGTGRGKATVRAAAPARGAQLCTPPFLKGEETFCGLEGAPAAVPDASRGLQDSLHELGKGGERREADRAVWPGLLGTGEAGPGPVWGCCAGLSPPPAPPASGPANRICTRVEEGVSDFSRAVFYLPFLGAPRPHALVQRTRGSLSPPRLPLAPKGLRARSASWETPLPGL